jgi:hypothetical protein
MFASLPLSWLNFTRFILQVIIECQKHDDYQESITWLLEYAEGYAEHGRKVAEHDKDSYAALTSVGSYFLRTSVYSHIFVQDDGLKTATSELRTLLERFANGQSMNIIFDAANTSIDVVNNGEELREWFRSLN